VPVSTFPLLRAPPPSFPLEPLSARLRWRSILPRRSLTAAREAYAVPPAGEPEAESLVCSPKRQRSSRNPCHHASAPGCRTSTLSRVLGAADSRQAGWVWWGQGLGLVFPEKRGRNSTPRGGLE
jgi:hypothetical protein